MKKVKAVALFSFAVASVLSFSANTYATADSISNLNVPSIITTLEDRTGFSYSFSMLSKSGSPLPSSGTITTNKSSDVYVTLVQWETKDREGQGTAWSADMAYDLEETTTKNKAGEISVRELLTSNNKTIGWTNVKPGTYKLIIKNTGSYWAAGNGFVRAYEK
ncbi:hypothetical protein [Paenibacillus chitinolyticus]|uniref:hypothetical protein n=1 Tax=Paenibacillus chitinolyticus TaxID=79263 RepID=UPI001C452613|nr:hypothetical protein [Paenibacillus chitinolyticus]MBV6715147.1 hypothetical protein [Paenibacillus chitinolyticus]